MQTYNNSVVLKFDSASTGNADAGASVTIRDANIVAGAGALSTIYDSDDVQILNPITTDADGNYSFKAANGNYDIVIRENEVNQFILADELITDGDDASTALSTVIPQTGGGMLTALRVNEIRDGGAYTVPLANSVLVNQIIHIDLPDQYKTFIPVISMSGADTIVYSGGTDTSITFDLANSESITFTSDGVSTWSL